VRVFEVVVHRLRMDLVHELATSQGRHARRPVVLVEVTTDRGSGWGECAALAEPTYTSEYADGAEAVIIEHLAPRLLDAEDEWDGTTGGMGLLSGVRGHQMAKAALEMAVLDAQLRSSDQSLAAFLGATADVVTAGATVSSGPPGAVVAEVAEVVEAGFGRVKCKITPGQDVDTIREVRASFPDLFLCVDANGAYDLTSPTHRRAISELDDLGLVAIEQPLAPEDIAGHAALTASLATPVVLDESVCDLAQLDGVLARRACDGVSIKPARLGGVLAARRAHDRCLAAGVHLVAGGMLETGLGRAAALAVAALPGFDLPGDLGPSNRYFEPELTDPHLLVDGMLAVPDAAGVGREPDRDLVDALRVRTTWIEPSQSRSGEPSGAA